MPEEILQAFPGPENDAAEFPGDVAAGAKERVGAGVLPLALGPRGGRRGRFILRIIFSEIAEEMDGVRGNRYMRIWFREGSGAVRESDFEEGEVFAYADVDGNGTLEILRYLPVSGARV